MLKQFSPSTTTKKEKMEEDVESLKQELSMHRSAINRKKSELNELRILINKLSEDNKNNKLLIAKILNIEMDKSFTKRELINTILNCKPTEEQKKELMEAYELINLKLKINDKKKILSENNYEISHLTKNATAKVLKELDNEYQLKCGHQKKIMKVIKKMEVEIKKNEKIILDLEEEFNIQKDKNKKLKEQENESEKKMKETENEKNSLLKEVLELKEKMRKITEKITKEKNKTKNEKDDRYINNLKKKIDEIKNYKDNKEEIKKNIEKKKAAYKKLEEKKLEQEKIISELLNKKNRELAEQIDQYEQEKNKLMKKINEPKLTNQKMKELEEELKSLRKENEKYKNASSNNNTVTNKPSDNINNNQKLTKVQQISESEKVDIIKNKNIIEKNKVEEEHLNEQIHYLQAQIKDVNNQIDNNQNEINKMKKLIEEIYKSKGKTQEENTQKI